MLLCLSEFLNTVLKEFPKGATNKKIVPVFVFNPVQQDCHHSSSFLFGGIRLVSPPLFPLFNFQCIVLLMNLDFLFTMNKTMTTIKMTTTALF